MNRSTLPVNKQQAYFGCQRLNCSYIPVHVSQNQWRQMLTAVSAIHDVIIINYDLKPVNLVSVCGTLKLIDFGIAKAITVVDHFHYELLLVKLRFCFEQFSQQDFASIL